MVNEIREYFKNYTHKELPWVLLIMMPNQLSIANVFAKYVNTFVYAIGNEELSRIKITNYSGRIFNKFSNHKVISSVLFKVLRSFAVRKVSVKPNYWQVPDPNLIDLVLVLDPIRINFDFRLFKNAVKAYWSQDCIHGGDYYSQVLAGVLDYDIVFCAHRQYMHRFNSTKVFWLPYACDPQLHKRIILPFKYDVAFIGNMPSSKSKIGKLRRELLAQLLEKLTNHKIFIGKAWQHDMIKLYNSSRLVLNISRSRELNMRVFEVLGCGRPLLTDYVDEITDIFKNKEHLAMYSSLNELIDLIEYYLKNEEEREEMAKRGQEECYKKHTLDHRVKTILEKSINFKINI
ncbi:MAG: CgeB family protein [Thermoprotei archaeon]